MASSLNTRLSREEYKKAKELEELRKSGAAPPEMDEEGNMINPHIPHYISRRPWYAEDAAQRPGLKHQRSDHFGMLKKLDKRKKKAQKKQRSKHKLSTAAAAAGSGKKRLGLLKRAGCSNCGSRDHERKDCLERPTRKGKKTRVVRRGGKDEDEGDEDDEDDSEEEEEMDYAAKRDRWRGYNPVQYNQVIQLHERVEEARRKKKASEIDRSMAEETKRRKLEREKRRMLKGVQKEQREQKGGDVSSSDSELDSSDDEVDDDVIDKGEVIQRVDARTRGTVRNLRLREDTAKYLLNLDPNSAYYDPKSRSMRGDPLANLSDAERKKHSTLFRGDMTPDVMGADAAKARALQSFVWQANQKGNEDINPLANPSQAEKLQSEYQRRRAAVRAAKRQDLMAKYGGEEHMIQPDAPERELLVAQSEAYAEYAEDGTLIRGQEKAVPTTKYVEDVYDNNHTSVWGSWYDLKAHRWGYRCCQQTLRGAYCTGKKEKAAVGSSSSVAAVAAAAAAASVDVPKEAAKPKEDEDEDDGSAGSALSGLAVRPSTDRDRRRANKRKAETERAKSQEEREREALAKRLKPTEDTSDLPEDATEEQRDAYLRNKVRADDPLFQSQ